MNSIVRCLFARGALAVVIIAITAWPSAGQDRFACTEVLGFSQSWEWFTGRSLSEYRDTVTVPSNVFLSDWQGRFEFGAAVERWSDPDFEGWEGAYISPQMCTRDQVDQIVFNLSGASREIQQWVQDILNVVEVLREKYPAVQKIVLQPVVGAAPGQCNNVRAVQNHPSIVSAIDRVVSASGSRQIAAGAMPIVARCDQFTDLLGHLSPQGALYVHELLVIRYSGGTGREAR